MSITKHIQIKRTSTPGKKPGKDDIEIGELAVNLADKLLFTKDTKDDIISLGAPVVDNLTTADSKKALSANQGKVLKDQVKVIEDQGKALEEKKMNKSDVINNLTTADSKKALSANQGKVLKDTKVSKSGDTMTGSLTSITTSSDHTDASFIAKAGPNSKGVSSTLFTDKDNQKTAVIESTTKGLNFTSFKPSIASAEYYFGLPDTHHKMFINKKEVATVNQLQRKNLLMNGNFTVWQRGTKFTGNGSSTGIYTADRWKVTMSNKVEVKQRPGEFYIENHGPFSEVVTISQSIEDAHYARGKKFVLSTDAPRGFSFFCKSSVGNIDLPIEPNLPFDINTSIPTGRVTITAKITLGKSASVIIKYIQLEVGELATDTEYVPYAEELARCQRYYQTVDIEKPFTYAPGSSKWLDGGSGPLKVTMRRTPTLSWKTQPSLEKCSTDRIMAVGPNLVRHRVNKDSSSGTYSVYRGVLACDADY